MAIATCACGQKMRIPDQAAGQRFKCPKCGKLLAGESASPPPAVTAAPPAVQAVAPDEPRPARRERRAEDDERNSPPRTSGLAITSLILSIGGLLCPPLALVGIVLGVSAMVSISSSGGRKKGTGLAIAGCVLSLLFGALSSLGIYALYSKGIRPMADHVRKAAEGTTSANNLKQIGVAMHHYHEQRGAFPAAAYTGDGDQTKKRGGRALLSWRVTLLQFMGPDEQALYREFRLNEAWDSPHNLALLPRMPAVYQSPGAEDKGTYGTRYQVFVGPGTAFEPNARVNFANMQDGSSNTVLVVETEETVPWTKPQDIVYNPAKPLPRLYVRNRGTVVLLASGAVQTFRENLDQGEFRKTITRNDGLVIDFDRLQR